MSRRIYIKAQYNYQPGTRPEASGAIRPTDPKRPAEGARPGQAQRGPSVRRPKRV